MERFDIISMRYDLVLSATPRLMVGSVTWTSDLLETLNYRSGAGVERDVGILKAVM